jgi:prepilin-type N-terminal cleavage/methylation domain-containing protein
MALRRRFTLPRFSTASGLPQGPFARLRRGFTLIEIIVSISIVLVMAIIFGTMINQMDEAWTIGQQRMQNFQDGRAILEMVARELAPATISPSLQFVQNPATASSTTLTSLLPSGTAQAMINDGNTPSLTPTDSLFWARPFTPNSYGNIYETGYMLTAATGTTKKYQLLRFNLAPNAIATSLTTKNTHASNSTYWIYDPLTAYATTQGYTTASPWPPYNDAPWLTTLASSSSTAFSSATSVVSDGVIGFWVRCLDKNGNAIPWLYQSSLYSSSFAKTPNIKFNSAAAFNPATLGTANSFTYSSPPVPASISGSTLTAPSGTVAANRLPTAVELTIITVDPQTLSRLQAQGLTVPAMPVAASATAVPASIQTYVNSTLLAPPYEIRTARVFSTTVRLMNGTD